MKRYVKSDYNSELNFYLTKYTKEFSATEEDLERLSSFRRKRTTELRKENPIIDVQNNPELDALGMIYQDLAEQLYHEKKPAVWNSRRPIKSDNENWWYGIPGIRMIWHGEWNDPELECDGYIANYYDVENTMYGYAKDDGVDADNDEAFAKYVRDHADDAKYLVTEYGTKNSSQQIKSARYIATDPESGEVLGSADTYEEAVNEWGEDVTITDSEAAEGQQEEEGLFSSYEEETEEGDMEIESSKKPSGDKAFLSKIVSAFCTGTMTEEQAVKRIALRNNCNRAFARNIFSSAMEDSTLIQSSTMEIAEDLNKDFNVDGDIESWSEDYVPKSGKANTIGGEILRATAQIANRFYNDGDKIGIGNGKETVNPAARYIIENAVELTGIPDELQDILDNNSDINLSDESYEEWVDDFKYAIEDYLRNHEELFHSPNKVDMWDFKDESDTKVAIDDIFIKDEDGSKYFFQGGPEGWHCYDIRYANNPKYNVGDIVNSGDIKAAGGDTDEEFVTFNIDGFTYSAELYDNDEYEVTDIDFDGQLVHKDEEWTTEDFERYQIYDSSNNSELSIEDLY